MPSTKLRHPLDKVQHLFYIYEQPFYACPEDSGSGAPAALGVRSNAMVTAAPPRPSESPSAATLPLPLAAPSRSDRLGALRARPIPVAAYPAGRPRWVTYDGRRHRVIAVHDQPALDPSLAPEPYGSRRIQVELADGHLLTLLHDSGAWYGG
jgi:hypothetical protein